MPDGAELVESVKDNARWQQGWDFLELSRVPIGCAVSRDHPLFDRECFTLEDLRGSHVLLLDRGNSSVYQEIERVLASQGIPFEIHRECSGSLIWDCSIHHHIMIVPACWEDILFDLKVKPCTWDFTVPYGFFYQRNPSPPLREFIAFIKRMNQDDIISY